jgi:insulysin
MKKKKSITILAVLFILFIFHTLSAELNLPQKHADDKRVFRTLVLDNQLKVMLVSDPNINKSAASLQVDVGSYSDPKDTQGLAHFLEHMLFLGTKKYPNVEEYSNYLKTRGGYSNAFTAGNRTNYQLEIFHDDFEGALDRFAQFFISPLFNPAYTAREINAVNSEHSKNIMHDGRRQYQLIKTLYHKNHAANHFATGDKDTLKDVKPAVLKEFYAQYYSANLMTLCLMSKKSLDWMETKTKKYFTEIKNTNADRPKFKEEYIPLEKNFRLIKMKPVKNSRQLLFEFGLPESVSDYKYKTLGYLGFIIGHEGKGSLLSLLKKKNLATGLSAGGHIESKDFSSFNVTITLTPQGVKKWKDCAIYMTQYINLMKKEGFKNYIYEEIKTKSSLDEVYSDKGEGAGQAVKYANDLSLYPVDIAYRVDSYFEEASPQSYKSFLSKLTVENMLCILSAQSVKTDKKEIIYGTEYSINRDEEFYKKLVASGVSDEMHLPLENPFMPKSAKVLPNLPQHLISADKIDLWYSQDTEFKRPKVSMLYKFKYRKGLMGLRDMVFLDFYTACVREQLNEWYYPAALAGIGYNISAGGEGLVLNINGFNDAAEKLLLKVVAEMQNNTLSPKLFEAVKDRLVRSYQNFDRNQAYQVVRSINRKFFYKNQFLPTDKIKYVKDLTKDNLKVFTNKFFSKVKIEALIHGNMSSHDATRITNTMLKNFPGVAIKENEIYQQGYLKQEKPEKLLYRSTLPTNNACFRRNVLIGRDSIELRLITKIINNFVTEPFYTELRTKQQLGYIVYGGAYNDELYSYLTFIIQSGNYTPDALRKKADDYIITLPKLFAGISEDKFLLLKKSVSEALMVKNKQISGVANKLFRSIYQDNQNFDLKNDELKILAKITKEQVQKTLDKVLSDKDQKRLDILLYAKGQTMPEAIEVGNIEKFKDTRVFEVKNK